MQQLLSVGWAIVLLNCYVRSPLSCGAITLSKVTVEIVLNLDCILHRPIKSGEEIGCRQAAVTFKRLSVEQVQLISLRPMKLKSNSLKSLTA